MRLVLHVGHPKCGSTTVQSLLWNNREWLTAQGIFLLGAEFRVPGEDAQWDWPLWFINAPADHTKPSLGERLVARLPQFEALGAKTLILSAENLSEPTRLQHLTAAFDSLQTSAIYYIRRQDEFLVSSWRQWGMKRGISLHQHILRRLAERKPNYRATLECLTSLLGRGHVRTSFLDPNFLFGGTLATDFWHALGLKGETLRSSDSANPSPDRASLIFLSRNPHLFKDEHDDYAAQVMLRADLEPPRRLTVDRHIQRSLKMIFDEENIELARDFMAGRDGANVIRLDASTEDGMSLSMADVARLKAMLTRIDNAEIASAIALL